MSTKKSNFVSQPTIPAASTFDYVANGQNFKLPVEDLLASLGVTGTIVQDGAVTGTPVLDTQGTINNIRNLEALDGISLAVSAQNGVSVGANLVAGNNVGINSNGSGGLVISAGSSSVDDISSGETAYTTTGNVTLICNNTAAAVVTLNASPSEGEAVTVKRRSGLVTLSGNVDGNPTTAMSTAYAAVRLIYTAAAAEWSIL